MQSSCGLTSVRESTNQELESSLLSIPALPGGVSLGLLTIKHTREVTLWSATSGGRSKQNGTETCSGQDMAVSAFRKVNHAAVLMKVWAIQNTYFMAQILLDY